MKTALCILCKSLVLWLIAFGIFWIGALLWLHHNHAEAYRYYASLSTPGSHGIDTQVLDDLAADKRLAILTGLAGSLVVSQVSLILSMIGNSTQQARERKI